MDPPQAHDVLCGRGKGAYRHIGNIAFNELVNLNKKKYATCKKADKIKISQSIVNAIRKQNPPGRFLDYDSKQGIWRDVGDKKAIEKTSQALREGRTVNSNSNITTPKNRAPIFYKKSVHYISHQKIDLDNPLIPGVQIAIFPPSKFSTKVSKPMLTPPITKSRGLSEKQNHEQLASASAKRESIIDELLRQSILEDYKRPTRNDPTPDGLSDLIFKALTEDENTVHMEPNTEIVPNMIMSYEKPHLDEDLEKFMHEIYQNSSISKAPKQFYNKKQNVPLYQYNNYHRSTTCSTPTRPKTTYSQAA